MCNITKFTTFYQLSCWWNFWPSSTTLTFDLSCPNQFPTRVGEESTNTTIILRLLGTWSRGASVRFLFNWGTADFGTFCWTTRPRSRRFTNSKIKLRFMTEDINLAQLRKNGQKYTWRVNRPIGIQNRIRLYRQNWIYLHWNIQFYHGEHIPFDHIELQYTVVVRLFMFLHFRSYFRLDSHGLWGDLAVIFIWEPFRRLAPIEPLPVTDTPPEVDMNTSLTSRLHCTLYLCFLR